VLSDYKYNILEGNGNEKNVYVIGGCVAYGYYEL
jgi:hypothetical protein